MKKLLIATAVALATAGTAGAADLPVKAPPYVPPAMTWTGCYVSGGIGYGLWNQDESFNDTRTSSGTYTTGGRGWLGRVGVGCDYQVSSSFVIGAFADYDWMSLKSTVLSANGALSNEKETAAGNVGGRIGFLPYENLLTFVSAGWTEARFSQRDFFNPFSGAVTGVSLPQHDYRGWFIGGGTEYRLPFAHNLTWKTEYRFSEYRADNLAAFVTATGVANGQIFTDQKFVQTVTTSLVWRFNFGGPVVARY
jgi:outer membrane immunogenic protein